MLTLVDPEYSPIAPERMTLVTERSQRSACRDSQALVLMVEQHPLLREVLEHILRSRVGLESFEYAESGDAAVRAVSHLEPQLVLMDFNLPDMNGLEAAERILERAPGTHIVLLIEDPEAEYRAAAEASGVTTCVAKTAIWDDLPIAVTRLLEPGTTPGENAWFIGRNRTGSNNEAMTDINEEGKEG